MSARLSKSSFGLFPSTASLMSEIVLSMLRRRVLGLVIVVPSDAWRPWPRRNGEAEADSGEVGEMGEPGEAAAEVLIGAGDVPAMTCSSAAVTPLGDTGGTESSAGVCGREEMRPLPSSDSGS